MEKIPPDFENCRFISRINASLTHELRNVLAVIRETGGLLQDILSMQAPEKDTALRIQQGLGSIQDQVLRASGLLDRMNRFAHATDHEEESLDLRETATAFFRLTERFCRMAQISLDVETEGPEIRIRISRFYLFSALFQALESCLSLPEGSTVTVSFSPDGTVHFRMKERRCPQPPLSLPGGFLLLHHDEELRLHHGAAN